MVRALAPYLLVAVLIGAGGGAAYGLGGPIWLMHLSVLVGGLVVLPAYTRWDEREYPPHEQQSDHRTTA